MGLQTLIPGLSRAPVLSDAVSGARSDADFSLVEGMRAPLLASLLETRRGDVGPAQALLAVTATSREAEALRASLATWLPSAGILPFPAWETLPHERLSPSAETVGTRLRTLRRIRDWSDSTRPEHLVVVASVRAALQPLAPGLDRIPLTTLTAGQRGVDLARLAADLVELAYVRVDMVTRRGEFAVRGGILDVFPPDAEHPVRVDLFGDELDELREFSVADQRSAGEPLESVSLAPSRELLLTDAVRQHARELEHEFPTLAPILTKVGEGIPAEGMEALAPVLLPELVPLTSYLPAEAAVALLSPERIASRAKDLVDTDREFLEAAWSAATAGAEAPIDLGRSFREGLASGSFLTVSDLRAGAAGRTWWTLGPFGAEEATRIEADAVPSFAGNAAGAADHVAQLLKDGWRVVITAGGAGLLDRAAQVLADREAGARIVPNPSVEPARSAESKPRPGGGFDSGADAPGSTDGGLDGGETPRRGSSPDGASLVEPGRDAPESKPSTGNGLETPRRGSSPDGGASGVAELVLGTLDAGFQAPGEKLAVLSESEFYGRAAGIDSGRAKKLASRRKNVVDPLQLKAGDFVVHQTHGIGRFVELIQREVASGVRTPRGPLGSSVTNTKVTREYLVIEYAPSKRGHPGDRLSVPTDQLDQLTRYVGGEAPSLSKMGGSDWAAAKGRARKAVRDIAVELVKLYSARMAAPGYAFSKDTPWQRELEEAFPFVETPDQLQTIDEVKADMERSIPMDRLISGDVGYGKTEIAVRAAFKAVQDGKQVVMLVPTTLLVRQHLETFAERFAGFPVHLRPLSRFQSDKEAKETIEGLASGQVDVVIGTHRLLSESIRFKDLGLVIVDEEQRFGVEHKDQLKKLKTNVDVLAMSATPIPRTLEMAVTGIREMSTLATPPEDRHPILTYVGANSDKQVAAAIRRELLREGQVFYVHNRVKSITGVAAKLADLVPEARIGIAHGQLSEAELERVVVEFWEGRYDVLVTTTIIETGIDIANANTLIVDRADKYGLSQLHQIRGRVGRGRERAYAYFLYDGDTPLTELAQDRLETIAANNELGGGMQIALKDLEIRGAGNLLGGEQSGHIAGVGFDLYLRMIGEAVSTFRGDVAEGQTELRLELPVEAHIPDDYIASERLRLEAYQKLSTAAAPSASEDALDAVRDELADRYGEPPAPVQTLLAVSRLRRLAQKAGLSEVVAAAGRLRVAPADLPDSLQVRLQRMYPGAKLFAQNSSAMIPMPEGTEDADLVAWVGALLAAIFPAREPEPAAAS